MNYQEAFETLVERIQKELCPQPDWKSPLEAQQGIGRILLANELLNLIEELPINSDAD